MKLDVLKRFLTGTDETGRFVMRSKHTGIVYFIEPISSGKPDLLWGDIDPSTKKLTGNYGNKRNGCVHPTESLITKENGFINIDTFKGNPIGEIDRRDKIYENLK